MNQDENMATVSAPDGEKSALATTALAAMGVVLGDIGTSPLYTIREIFGGHHPVPVTVDNVLGILSLVFWAMTITVSLKYVLFIKSSGHGSSPSFRCCTSTTLAKER
jgi:KUP system potassium uptake protein